MTKGHTENGDLENHGNASYLKIPECTLILHYVPSIRAQEQFSGQAQESKKQSGHLP